MPRARSLQNRGGWKMERAGPDGCWLNATDSRAKERSGWSGTSKSGSAHSCWYSEELGGKGEVGADGRPEQKAPRQGGGDGGSLGA